MKQKEQTFLDNLELLLRLSKMSLTQEGKEMYLIKGSLKESIKWAKEKGFIEEKLFAPYFEMHYVGYAVTESGKDYLEQCAQNPPRELGGFEYDAAIFYKLVGKDLAEKVFGGFANNRQEAMKWFYEFRIKPYDNMTPFELFNIREDNLEGILDSAEWGGI